MCLHPRLAQTDSSVTIITVSYVHLTSVSLNAFDVSSRVLRLMNSYLNTYSETFLLIIFWTILRTTPVDMLISFANRTNI